MTSRQVRKMGLFDATKAQKAFKISQPTLSRWVDKGVLMRVERGVYVGSPCNIPAEYMDFAVACFRFGPQAVIGGPSALFHYNLIDMPPRQIWVLVPSSRQLGSKVSRYRLIRSKQSLFCGVLKEKHFKITNTERTLVEAAKFSHRWGRQAVFQAFQRALQRRETTIEKIGRMASKMDLQNVVLNFIELI